MTKKKQYFSPASCGEGEIYTRYWVPDGQIKAILILVHGMSEHADRFECFANYLNEKGILVVASDVAGHGKSTQMYGHFGNENGWENNLKDIKRLYDTVTKEYPDLPVFMLGNSMGTALVRCYIKKYEGVDGVILFGTMDRNPIVTFLRKRVEFIKKRKGPLYKSKFLQMCSLATFFRNKKHRNTKHPRLVDLKSLLRQIFKERITVGEPFTVSGYIDLYKGIEESTSKDWANGVSKSTAYLIASGADDPVGFFGKSVNVLVDDLTANGNKDVTGKLFEGRNHEVLQFKKNIDSFNYIRAWISERTKKIKHQKKRSVAGAGFEPTTSGL